MGASGARHSGSTGCPLCVLKSPRRYHAVAHEIWADHDAPGSSLVTARDEAAHASHAHPRRARRRTAIDFACACACACTLGVRAPLRHSRECLMGVGQAAVVCAIRRTLVCWVGSVSADSPRRRSIQTHLDQMRALEFLCTMAPNTAAPTRSVVPSHNDPFNCPREKPSRSTAHDLQRPLLSPG